MQRIKEETVNQGAGNPAPGTKQEQLEDFPLEPDAAHTSGAAPDATKFAHFSLQTDPQSGITKEKAREILDQIKRVLKDYRAENLSGLHGGMQGTFILAYQKADYVEAKPLLKFNFCNGDYYFENGLDTDFMTESSIHIASTTRFGENRNLPGKIPSGFYQDFYLGDYSEGDLPLMVLNTKRGRLLCSCHDDSPERTLVDKILSAVYCSVQNVQDQELAYAQKWSGLKSFAERHKLAYVA